MNKHIDPRFASILNGIAGAALTPASAAAGESAAANVTLHPETEECLDTAGTILVETIKSMREWVPEQRNGPVTLTMEQFAMCVVKLIASVDQLRQVRVHVHLYREEQRAAEGLPPSDEE